MSGKPNDPKTPSQVERIPADPGDGAQSNGRREIQVTVDTWQGPIPPPEVLRHYNDIVPNGAERIFAQFEAETKHRHKMEARFQYLPVVDQLAGRVCALLFAFACLILVGYAIQQKAEWAAAVLGGAMIVAGINAFMRRGSDGSKNVSQPKKNARS